MVIGFIIYQNDNSSFMFSNITFYSIFVGFIASKSINLNLDQFKPIFINLDWF